MSTPYSQLLRFFWDRYSLLYISGKIHFTIFYIYIHFFFRFEAVLNSKQDIDTDQTFEVKVGTLKKEDGGGGKACYIMDTESDENSLMKKRSIVYIPIVENDYLCASRAIVTCLAKLRNMPKNQFSNFTRKQYFNSDKPNSQKTRAIELQTRVGLPLNSPVLLRDLYLFEIHLNVQIVVISGDLCNEVCYKGYVEREDKIFLYHKDSHFHSITNVNGLIPFKTLCLQCFSWYSENNGKKIHHCGSNCTVCNKRGCCFTESAIECSVCKIKCKNRECFEAHKKPTLYKKGAKKGEVKFKSMCESKYKCQSCSVLINLDKRKKEEHVCGEFMCKQCNKYVIGEHYCYFRIKKPRATSGKFLFYDFETTQDKLVICDQGYNNSPRQNCPDCLPDQMCPSCRKCINCSKPYCGQKRFVPNFLVCQTVCNSCKKDEWHNQALCSTCGTRCKICSKKDKFGEEVKLCDNGLCGRREKVFGGVRTTEEFCKWLFTPQHQNFTCIAHNAKAFDAHFILEYCLSNTIVPSIIYNGSKIMKLHISNGLNITFIDSLNFLPMALKKLPKALDLGNDLRKGFFPHYFNTDDNFNYHGKIPGQEFYGVEFMGKQEREEFLEWHKSNLNTPFDFQAEILEYTRSDVSILREACMKFRDLLAEATTLQNANSPPVDVFAHVTIASSAMQIIRQLTMEEEHEVICKDGSTCRAILKAGVWRTKDTGQIIEECNVQYSRFVKSQIPQPPAHGYRRTQNHSLKSIMWLEWIRKQKNGKKIRHARNGGEYKIPNTNYYADGYDENEKKVYEFLGCRWHGHGCIPSRNAKDPQTSFTMQDLFNLALVRESNIKSAGFSFEKIWECQWDKMVKENFELADFVKNFDMPTPLQPREGLYGGRVTPIKLYYQRKPGETIKYKDFCSLYPAINYWSPYPTCHPRIITDSKIIDTTLQSYFGLAKVKILPPSDLFHPVLPFRCNGRLKFPLCKTCCQKESVHECQCDDELRCLVGTWSTEEIKLAISKGYKLVKVYEVYHYPEITQYDKSEGSGGLFSEYVSIFLKLKQQASGFPSHVKSEIEELRYIEHYREKQGIILDREKIRKNQGLRFVAKLFLNSCWGKFCERQNKVKTIFVKTKLDFAKIRNDVTKEVVDFHIVNCDIIAVDVKNKDTFEDDNQFTCEILGALTTSFARMRLYNCIDSVGEAVLYMDTDSIIYAEKDGSEKLPSGDLLGELTDELPENTHIDVFLSSGPKSYAYRTNTGECVLKLKGISLNFQNSQVINFDSVKKVIFDEIDKIRTPVSMQITRTKYTGIVFKRQFSKTYRKVFTKRVVIPGSFSTVPFGYRSVK